LTIVLTYEHGTLQKALTRGNGKIGEIVTANAKTFKNLPLRIPFSGKLVLRGEAIIKYSDFEKINLEIEDADSKYKNPRNLCSGSVRQLNSRVTSSRNVYFYAFNLVEADNVDFLNSKENQLIWLKKQGFETVQYEIITKENALDAISNFEKAVASNDFPSDGLVALYDDIEYGNSLGETAKFPRNSIAFKWADEVKETILREIEWSPSRTGLINPIAVFEPVELEGTTVSRASVHNVSIVKSLELGIGDRITVYKANMIIPQIAKNLTRSGNAVIPDRCPVCGSHTVITSEGVNGSDNVEVLRCENPDCQIKKILSFDLFVSRNALNVEGLSEQTIEKFITNGLLKNLGDIFELSSHKDEIIALDGFGETSYENLVREINNARNTTAARLIYALGIPNVGESTARLLAEASDENIETLAKMTRDELSGINLIGPVIAESIIKWFDNEDNRRVLEHILKYVNILKSEKNENAALKGLSFVITGSLNNFSNRDELKNLIEENGGKVVGSVSSKTKYLINNNTASTSGKNKKAIQLGIPVISEEEFLKMLNK
jgi:DNA ligase (NAD+)